MITMQGCHDWDPNFYCDVHGEWLHDTWHVVLDGEVFNITGRGEVYMAMLCCNGSISTAKLKSLAGTEISGRVVKAVECFATMSQFDRASVGLLLD